MAGVTAMGPLFAPAGTKAVIWPEELTTGFAAGTPLNATRLTLMKLAPLIVTVAPIAPAAGLKPLMTGVAVTVNTAALWSVPAGVLTRILPVVAPVGTVAVIRTADSTTNTEGELLKLTLVAPVRLTPVMATIVPIFPLAGAKPVMTGVVMTLRSKALAARPVGVG